MENDVFDHSSRSDPFSSSVLEDFCASCGPYGALLWLFLACCGPSEGSCWALFGVVLVSFGALVVFGVCVLRFVVAKYRLSEAFRKRAAAI